jgi:hypothetical protein
MSDLHDEQLQFETDLYRYIANHSICYTKGCGPPREAKKIPSLSAWRALIHNYELGRAREALGIVLTQLKKLGSACLDWDDQDGQAHLIYNHEARAVTGTLYPSNDS